VLPAGSQRREAPAQIRREHNLSESVLLKWRKEYEARGEAAFTEKQPSANEALEA
jgi:transposase-like protein